VRGFARRRRLPLKGLDWGWLIGADLPYGYGGKIKVLAAGGSAAKATKHGELADMGENVRDWSLDEPFNGSLYGAAGGQKGVECAQRLEEALLFVLPNAGALGLPVFLAHGGGERPIEKVAHVGENLDWHAAGAGKSGKTVWGTVECPRRPVGKAGKHMTQ
jgi:hypothetical protein